MLSGSVVARGTLCREHVCHGCWDRVKAAVGLSRTLFVIPNVAHNATQPLLACSLLLHAYLLRGLRCGGHDCSGAN